MEILLIENVQNLGLRGDIVNVKDGYARNFLLPRRKALPVTAGNKRQIELERERVQKLKAKELASAQELKTKLEAVSLAIAKKAGEHGQLFGSVTKGFEIDRHSINLEHVKATGTYAVDVRLYAGVHAALNLEVTALAGE
jgi:large subunit ribosomal protein L9